MQNSKGLRRAASLVALVLGLILVSTSTFAHHSRSHYSRDWSELEGEIVNVHWRNPHIYFTLKTSGDDGEDRLVLMETGGPRYLERTGFNEDTLNVGDIVVVGGRLSALRNTEFLLEKVTLPSGKVLAVSRDDLEANFQDPQIDTAAENKGIFRVWSIPPNNEREIHTSLNALGQEKAAGFNRVDNFATRCEAAGMPRLMWYPHPFEFVDLGDVLRLNIEIYNQLRTIHMNQTAAPDNFAGSPLGYSVGHWQDTNTLVVKTTGINWGRYTENEPLSEEAVVIERFTLSEDQGRLDLLIETTDPVYFNDPATVAAYWVAVGHNIQHYECVNIEL
jgi:hypothetical protein